MFSFLWRGKHVANLTNIPFYGVKWTPKNNLCSTNARQPKNILVPKIKNLSCDTYVSYNIDSKCCLDSDSSKHMTKDIIYFFSYS